MRLEDYVSRQVHVLSLRRYAPGTPELTPEGPVTSWAPTLRGCF